MRRQVRGLFVACVAAMALASCGGSPTTPKVPDKPIDPGPPANTAPIIDSIAVQGRRPRQPARFADIKETVDVTATVRDPETALEELIYQWTATAGTFTGTGRTVTWTAPDTIGAPATVTITLKVIENYGYPGQAKIYSQEVTSTQTLDLHDSVRELGEMSRQFLLDFSDTNIKDWQYIMRNFNKSACPQPGTVDDEKEDVIRNYTDYNMVAFSIGAPRVTVNFGGVCEWRGKLGDACAVVPSMWDSTHKPTGIRSASNGDDIIAAAYSAKDARWWLCASDYRPVGTLAPTSLFYGR